MQTRIVSQYPSISLSFHTSNVHAHFTTHIIQIQIYKTKSIKAAILFALYNISVALIDLDLCLNLYLNLQL